jgi:hypothetical protein
MLRYLFNEPRRQDQGILLEANQAIQQFLQRLHKLIGAGDQGPSSQSIQYKKLEIWSKSLSTALDELEQSQYCAEQYGRRIQKNVLADMTVEEHDDYYRHVYFYKNAIIRLFSLFDKTGSFLDDMFVLHTERVKPHFSYFTVLRQMHQTKAEPLLEQHLYDYKMKFDGPLRKLRSQRNMEIHHMNSEMRDDMLRIHNQPGSREPLENIEDNINDLKQGLEVATLSIREVFHYCSQKLPLKPFKS